MTSPLLKNFLRSKLSLSVLLVGGLLLAFLLLSGSLGAQTPIVNTVGNFVESDSFVGFEQDSFADFEQRSFNDFEQFADFEPNFVSDSFFIRGDQIDFDPINIRFAPVFDSERFAGGFTSGSTNFVSEPFFKGNFSDTFTAISDADFGASAVGFPGFFQVVPTIDFEYFAADPGECVAA